MLFVVWHYYVDYFVILNHHNTSVLQDYLYNIKSRAVDLQVGQKLILFDKTNTEREVYLVHFNDMSPPSNYHVQKSNYNDI